MKERRNVTYKYMDLNTKELNVDEMYQRGIDGNKLRRMVRNYDPCLVNAIKVSFRDGKYWIFDGQHTVAMEKAVHGKGSNVVVECKVFSGLSRLDEMELFVAQNGESSAVSIAEKYKALYNFGDEDVTGMVRCANAAGLRCDFTLGSSTNKIVAYSTLMKIYLRFKAKMREEKLTEMLTVMKTAWGGVQEGFTAELLRGMAKFYEVYDGEFKRSDLISCLQQVEPFMIVREGKSISTSYNRDSAYARVILRLFNKRRRATKLEDVL